METTSFSFLTDSSATSFANSKYSAKYSGYTSISDILTIIPPFGACIGSFAEAIALMAVEITSIRKIRIMLFIKILQFHCQFRGTNDKHILFFMLFLNSHTASLFAKNQAFVALIISSLNIFAGQIDFYQNKNSAAKASLTSHYGFAIDFRRQLLLPIKMSEEGEYGLGLKQS